MTPCDHVFDLGTRPLRCTRCRRPLLPWRIRARHTLGYWWAMAITWRPRKKRS